MLSTFDANPVDTLVLDFRGNTGGDSSVIDPLFSGLAQRLLSFSNPNFHAYDVIDKGTFSSGMLDAAELNPRRSRPSRRFPVWM